MVVLDSCMGQHHVGQWEAAVNFLFSAATTYLTLLSPDLHHNCSLTSVSYDSSQSLDVAQT